MNLTRRLLCIVIVYAVAASFSIANAQTGSLTIVANEWPKNVGDRIITFVKYHPPETTPNTFGFVLNFDPEVLHVESLSTENIHDVTAWVHRPRFDNTAGTFTMGGGSFNLDRSQEFATIEFRTVGPGESSLSFSDLEFYDAGEPVNLKTNSAQITVKDESAPQAPTAEPTYTNLPTGKINVPLILLASFLALITFIVFLKYKKSRRNR